MAKGIIGNLRVNLGLDSAQFQAGMASAGKGMDSLAKKAAVFGARVGIAMTSAAGAIGTFVKMTADSAARTGDVADRFGIAVESLQELRHAAEMSGVGIQSFDMAYRRFLRRSSEAARGTGAAKNAFAELGIVLTDNQKRMRNSEDIFNDVADAMQKIQDPTNKLRLAFQIFDTDGAAMVKMFENGSAGIKAFREQAQELGIVLSGEAVRSAQRFNDSLSLIGKLAEGFRNRLFTAIIPAFEHLAARIFDVSKNARVFDGVANALSAAMNLLARGIGFVLDNLDHLIDLFKIFVGAKIILYIAGVGGAMLTLARTVGIAAKGMLLLTSITRAKITLMAVLAGVIAKVTGTYETLVETLGNVGKGILDALPEGMKESITKLRAQVEELFSDVAGDRADAARMFGSYLGLGNEVVTSFAEAEKAAKKAAEAQRKAAEAYKDIVGDAKEYIAAQEIEQRTIGMTERAANALRFEFDLLADAQRAGINLTPQQASQLSGLAKAMASAQDATRKLRETFDFAKDTTKGFFSDIMQGLRNGEGLWKSFANAAVNALQKIADKLLDMALDQMINGILRSILGAIGGGIGGGDPWAGLRIPGNAMGTNNWRGGVTWVGERGPELVNLPRGSQVIPNHELDGMGAGGSKMTINVNVSGARGNAEIQQMVESGVRSGLSQYDHALPTRVQQIMIDPRAR